MASGLHVRQAQSEASQPLSRHHAPDHTPRGLPGSKATIKGVRGNARRNTLVSDGVIFNLMVTEVR